jgi:hypothetical protein
MYLTHYYILAAFNSMYYKDLITKDHLGEETVIKVGEKQQFIYPVKNQNKLYALPSEIVEQDKLPIKITKSVKLAYRSNVYHVIKKYNSFKIKLEKTMEFRQFIDRIGAFPHSKYNSDFLLYKILSVMLYLNKGFSNCVTEAAFGKNSIPGILKILMTDVAVFNPRTAPVLEAKLINKLIVLDELTNLENSQRNLMQEALLQLGDGKTSYEKGSRGSSKYGTKDEYDISKLSILILYNIFSYYQKAGQGDKYFDFVFTDAVKDRFLPLYFEGTIDSRQIPKVKHPKKYAIKYYDEIVKLIRYLKYIQQNLELEDKPFKLYKDYKLSKSGRQEMTFDMVLQGLRLYANDEIEYNKLAEQLYQANRKYHKMISAEISLQEEPVKMIKDGNEMQKTLM